MGMVLLFKVGEEKDLPPVNLATWPQCGDYNTKTLPFPVLSNSVKLNFNFNAILLILLALFTKISF